MSNDDWIEPRITQPVKTETAYGTTPKNEPTEFGSQKKFDEIPIHELKMPAPES
jgi:hypothetical protein